MCLSAGAPKSPELPEMGGAWQSRAFFAAMLAAVRGDDKKAGDILRDVAKSLEEQFGSKEGVKLG